jgi:hypothetical protein
MRSLIMRLRGYTAVSGDVAKEIVQATINVTVHRELGPSWVRRRNGKLSVISDLRRVKREEPLP